MSIERRDMEFRSEIEGNTLVGYAAVFNQVANIGGRYLEQISRNAFDEVLPKSDATFLYNHDSNFLLARQKSGTLRMTTDSEGLHFEADLPNTQLGNDIKEMVSRGDLSQCSFTFVPGKDSYSRAKNGMQLVTRESVAALRDLSVVNQPAYAGTSVSLRSWEDLEVEPISAKTRLVNVKLNFYLGR